MPQGNFGDTGFAAFQAGITGVNKATAENIIRAMLKTILIKNPDDDQLGDALFCLNNWLASGWTQRLHVCEVVKDDFFLTAGVNRYTIGPDGDFTAARPIKIESAYLRLSGQDYPLKVGVIKDQAQILVKTIQSLPRTIYYAQEYPEGAILFDFVPDQAYELFMHNWKPLLTLDDLDTEIALPMEYNRAMIFNGALDMAPQFNQKASAEVVKAAAESLDWITHVNGAEAPEAKFDSAITGGGRSHILSDE